MRVEQWVNRLVDAPTRISNLVYFLIGATLTLSFAPVGWYWLAPVVVALALTGIVSAPRRQATWFGFWFGAGLFLAGTYWLYISIHVFGQAPLIIAIFLMICLVIIMGLYYAAAAWLINRFASCSVGILLVIPAVWTLDEWIRGWFLSGFPWMSLGYGQIDSPLAGFAPLAGVYGVSFIVLTSAAALLLFIRKSEFTRYWFLAGAFVPWFAGYGLQHLDWTYDDGPPVRTTIIQGGVSQDQKWLREQFSPTLSLYQKSIAKHGDSNLLVWPEAAIPAARDQVQEYVDLLQDELSAASQTLLFGILERDSGSDRVFNSVFLLDGSVEQVYRKRHLVPFGEFFPVPGFIRDWMRMMSLPYSDISSGAATQPLLRMPDGNRLAVAICYEDAYGAEQLYALPDASILVNVSNDAWFGDSIAPHQHLEIARMRALEVGRYVVRATNNGISAFIGPDGDLLDAGAQFEYVEMSRDVPPRGGLTPYAKFGNLPVLAICMVALFVGITSRSRENQ